MESSLAASIQSALSYLDTKPSKDHLMFELKMELRNLKVLLIVCFRKLGDVPLTASSSTLPSLFSRIEGAVRRVSLLKIPINGKLGSSCRKRMSDAAAGLNSLGRQVDKKWCSCWGMTSPLLTVDDEVAVAGSIIGSCLDFTRWLVAVPRQDKVEVKAIDEFQVQIQFLRSFLVYAKCVGVQLSDLLLLTQPIAINAARVFFGYGCPKAEWIEQVQFKCATVNGMVTEFQIYQAYAQSLISISTTGSKYSGMGDNVLMDFLDSLKSLLWDVLRHAYSKQDPIIELYARLRSCTTILKQEHPISLDGKNIKGQIGGWIHDAGFLICSLHHTHVQKDLGRISDLLREFDAIEAQTENMPSQSKDVVFGGHSINANINIFQGDEEDLNVHSQMSSHQPSQPTSQVVGFQDDEVESMLDRLIRGSRQLQIVTISGMAGIGKTTFSLKLYNLRSIMYHFQVQARCSVSQVPDKKKILVQLLNQILGCCGNYLGMTEDDLADSLRRSLKGKRYLILLDDVWSSEVLNSLKKSFPNDSTQSRIILTSRHTHINPHGLLDGKPYSLRLRQDDECFEILKVKLSREEGWNLSTGMEIAELCKGLPLVVVIVAGLLGTVKKEGWTGIIDHLRSGSISQEERCNRALELSFKHLPDDLKLCFIYIGAFPIDEKVSVTRLIRLWMAEGFVKRNGSKTARDVGMQYMDNLIQRSLLTTFSRKKSIGGDSYCQLHDILHDFCVEKARQDHTFHLLNGYDQLSGFNESSCLQRLCIHSRPIDFTSFKLYCPRAHSLLLFSSQSARNDHYFFDMSFIIQIYKLLKVLDLEQFGLVAEIPSEIELLTRLTYLSANIRLAAIPFSLFNLSSLETLVVDWPNPSKLIPFPGTFWNLQKLKYLHMLGSFSLPVQNSCAMLELETLSGVIFKSEGNMEKQLSRLPNIRRLRCRVKFSKFVIPNFLNQLDSLLICGDGKIQCEFGSAQNLKDLTLAGFELSREAIAVIGKLPELKHLNFLENVSFSGCTLEMEEGEFSKLKKLSLSSANLRQWTASDEQLPCLRKLVFLGCTELEEIPVTCLENSPTLEMIYAYECSSSLESLVRDIEAVHEDYGNFIKINSNVSWPVRRGKSDQVSV